MIAFPADEHQKNVTLQRDVWHGSKNLGKLIAKVSVFVSLFHLGNVLTMLSFTSAWPNFVLLLNSRLLIIIYGSDHVQDVKLCVSNCQETESKQDITSMVT